MGLRELQGLATLLVLLLAGWSLFSLLGDEPDEDRLSVVLLLEDAEGLRTGTPVRTRGVTVGEVRRVALAPGGRGAEVLCSLSPTPGAAPRAASRFWIVRPWFGGIASGGGGLDTLIKDSYIAFEVGDPAAPLLASGSRVPGMRLPPDSPGALLDLPPAPGDLEFAVRFPESGGLVPAAPVRHRGIAVGLVTAVDLLTGGDGVEVRARVERRYRGLVATESVFWVDGVDIRAGWQGVSVEGLDKILGGVALSFHTPDDRGRTPAPDGVTFIGREERPQIDWKPPPHPAEGASDATAQISGDDPILASLVTVHYACVEADWLSRDDRFERTSPGVLHRTPDGLPAVLVGARAVDGRLWIEDGRGEPEIRDESITVERDDGSVLEGGVAWRSEPATDLALLRLRANGATLRPLEITVLAESERAGPVDLYVLSPEGWRRRSATLDASASLVGVPPATPDAVLVRDGRAIGLWRGARDDAGSHTALFDDLPPALGGPRRSAGTER